MVLRLLYIRIFLLRPILLLVAQASNNTEAKDHKNEDRLENQLAVEACKLCVSTAQTLIEHIYENMNNFYWTSISHKLHCKASPANLPPPPSADHKQPDAFSCAVVFIAAQFGPAPDLDINSASLQASWSQCIELFEYYKPQLTSASHVLRILETLEDRLKAKGPAPTTANEDMSTDWERLADSSVSLSRLEGLGFDSNWAMLDDLLPADWFATSINRDMGSAEGVFGIGWEELT